MFMHGSWGHILGNMLFLAIFGKNVEDAFGHLRYLAFYVAGGFVATMTQTAVTLLFGTASAARVPNLGASGAIAAVLGAFIVLYPTARIRTLVLVFFVQIPAWVYLGGWFLYQLVEGHFGLTSASANGGGVAFFAHIGGFVFGAVVTLALLNAGRVVPQSTSRRRPPSRRSEMQTQTRRTHDPTDRDLTVRVAKATAAALAVAALAFGIWQVRSVLILLLLALTLAAAIRPGVEWLGRHRVPESVAILLHFLVVGGAVACSSGSRCRRRSTRSGTRSARTRSPARRRRAMPPESETACSPGSSSTSTSSPRGTELLHPVATYGHKAGEAVVAIFFTLAATWYCVSERDAIIKLLTALAPEAKRDRARETYLALDRRLGAYTRLRFLMVFAVGAVLSAGFYVIGLNYWLLVGAFVGLVEIVPMIGPIVGSILVLAVGVPQSLHIAALSLLWLVVVREFQSYVVNPHIGQTVGLSPLVTLLSVAVVGVLFGGFAVILAVPFTSAVATLIDVLVLGHEPPTAQPRRSLRLRRSG